jgi:hypothetical protein
MYFWFNVKRGIYVAGVYFSIVHLKIPGELNSPFKALKYHDHANNKTGKLHNATYYMHQD